MSVDLPKSEESSIKHFNNISKLLIIQMVRTVMGIWDTDDYILVDINQGLKI